MPDKERSTIYAVADRAGVSIATVSRVLRGTAAVAPRTRDRVLSAATELRYLPSGAASQLASSRQATLGLVLPHIDGAYYSDLIVGFEQEAGEHDHSVSLLLANPRHDATRSVRDLAERVSGLGFLARSSAGDELITDLAGPRRVVTVARGALSGVPSLRVESLASARALTDHLVATGRRRFCYLGTPEPGSDVEERVAGFREALDEHGLQPVGVHHCGLDEESGTVAVREVLDRWPDVDALVCGNDLVALSALRELRERHRRVPDDCAVVGWDDILAARHVTPGLTTVRQPVQQVGRLAARLLITGNTAQAPARLPSSVVHRNSCC